MDDDRPLGKPIDQALLDIASHLPRKPEPVTLTGELVILRPVDLEADSAPLFEASDGRAVTLDARSVAAYDADVTIWRYMPWGPFADLAAMRASLATQAAAPDGLALTVVDRPTGRPVGVVNLMSNDPGNLKIELGGIWYSPVVQRTGVNAEATWLMLRHAFGLGYRRLEWKCDALNARSRRAALRMGFRFEGIQEQHRITKGRNRDTAWFRIVVDEWPMIEPRLKALVNG